MTAEIICVGTELLLGNVVNSNATFLSAELSALGINVFHHVVVGDNHLRLEEELKRALLRSDIIITTGGLGPTYDDMTKETAAKVMGLSMELNESVLENLKVAFCNASSEFTKNNESQAYFPKGSEIVPNDWGTAPSCIIREGSKMIILLPGPPREMKNIFNRYIRPMLQELSGEVIVSKFCRILGMGESTVETKLEELLKESVNPSVAPYAGDGEVMLRVTAKAKSVAEGEALCEPVVAKIIEELGECVYTTEKDNVETVLVDMLAERSLKIATCESCTGGAVAQRITSVAGSSKVFECGLVTYSDRIKQQVANIDASVLMRYGALSRECAADMARNVRILSGADIGIGVTGVAGMSDVKGVKSGTVYIAADSDKGTEIMEYTGMRINERDFNVRRFTSRAIDLARRTIIKQDLRGN